MSQDPFINDQAELWHKRVGITTLHSVTHAAEWFCMKNNLQRRSSCMLMKLFFPFAYQKIIYKGEVTTCGVSAWKQTGLLFPVNKAWEAVEKLLIDLYWFVDLWRLHPWARMYGLYGYSRICKLYFLKKKFEVASVVCEFRTWIEIKMAVELRWLDKIIGLNILLIH